MEPEQVSSSWTCPHYRGRICMCHCAYTKGALPAPGLVWSTEACAGSGHVYYTSIAKLSIVEERTELGNRSFIRGSLITQFFPMDR
jgi:hypothetical protein